LTQRNEHQPPTQPSLHQQEESNSLANVPDGRLPQPVDRPCFGTSVNASKEKKSINKENMTTMHFGEKEVYDRLMILLDSE
jgi:hypothetical protein